MLGCPAMRGGRDDRHRRASWRVRRRAARAPLRRRDRHRGRGCGAGLRRPAVPRPGHHPARELVPAARALSCWGLRADAGDARERCAPRRRASGVVGPHEEHPRRHANARRSPQALPRRCDQRARRLQRATAPTLCAAPSEWRDTRVRAPRARLLRGLPARGPAHGAGRERPIRPTRSSSRSSAVYPCKEYSQCPPATTSN